MSNLTVKRTKPSAPESYDVMDYGTKVGELKVSSYYVTAETNDGEIIYEADVDGRDSFEDYERHRHIQNALAAMEEART